MDKEIIRTEDLLAIAKRRSGVSKEQLRICLRAILGAVSECVDDDKTVVLDNFGRFYPRLVSEHTVTPPPPHNQPVTIPDHVRVCFHGSKNLLNYHVKY